MTYELAGTATEPGQRRSDMLVESGWQLQLDVLLQPALRRLATVTAFASYIWVMPAFLAYHPTPHWPHEASRGAGRPGRGRDRAQWLL